MLSVGYLEEIFRAIGKRAVRYFGDLDPSRLRIPRLASAKAAGLGLPLVEPDLWSYCRLLELGSHEARPGSEPLECEPEDIKWLQTLAKGCRLVRAAKAHCVDRSISVALPILNNLEDTG